ncbi:MAG TPA: hypothetical protein RMH99_32460, partial [Sandaracinaceae bacterium LLY-WYZ-13_1]|nr:hypothetical protein [Sandaracinaceae bacterium LLY-WYZ-13_1]
GNGNGNGNGPGPGNGNGPGPGNGNGTAPELANGTSTAPPTWTAQTLADAIAERLTGAARAIRRARWLVLLSEASIAWGPPDARRLIVLRRGQIERQGSSTGAVPPCPPGGLRRVAERRRALADLAARDRLRVVTTELRRLVDEAGADPVVRLGPAGLVRGEALRRLLRRI